MSVKKPVIYKDKLLGELMICTREDWQGKDREPTEKDFFMMAAVMGADLTYEILEREPKQFDEIEPTIPWPLIVIKLIANTYSGHKDEKLEEDIIYMYTMKYGVDQFLKIWGADVYKLAEDMKNCLEEPNSP